jgi:hypothetical protein
VVQVNPSARDDEPTSMVEIADRRNELSGNLSLHQELGFIEKINQLLDEGLLAAGGRYQQIVVRLVELARPRLSRSLGTASKLNRDPEFIRDLIAHGEARAGEFLAALAFEQAWRRRDPAAVLACFADDAELTVGPPFPRGGRAAGAAGDRPVRPRAADHRPARRPDPQAGGPRPGHLDGAGLPRRPRRPHPGPRPGRAARSRVTSFRLGG